MVDIEKVKAGIYEMLLRCSWDDIDKERHRFQPVLNDALELLKEKDNPWRFFNFRQATEEEKEYYKVEYGDDEVDDLEMIENVPGDGEEVLLWTGRHFTVDTYDDGMFDGIGEIEKGMAWRYLPEIPKDGEQE